MVGFLSQILNKAENFYGVIRGGGGGQYGVVTEYVLKAYPVLTSAVLGTLTLSINGTDNSSLKDS